MDAKLFVIITGVSLFFAEHLFGKLFTTCTRLSKALVNFNRPRVSAVRKIGSKCTWINAQRTLIDARILCRDVPAASTKPSTSCPSCQCQSINSFKRQELQTIREEILELRNQVEEILMAQEYKLRTNVTTSYKPLLIENDNGDVASASVGLLGPPPPPPPPPMPSTPILPKLQLQISVKIPTMVKKVSTSSVIQELKTNRPKLRHVELSPGGRPVKVVRPLTMTTNSPTPGQLLLRKYMNKRYQALHSPSPPISPNYSSFLDL